MRRLMGGAIIGRSPPPDHSCAAAAGAVAAAAAGGIESNLADNPLRRRAFSRYTPRKHVALDNTHAPSFELTGMVVAMPAKHILLIEDERPVANMLGIALRNEGYDVDLAETAAG